MYGQLLQQIYGVLSLIRMGGGDRGFFEQSEPNLRFGAGQYVIILLSKKCIKKTTFKGRFMFPYRSLEPHLRTPNPGLNPRLPPFYITNARGKGGDPAPG
jgi:hypothetical protein